MPAALERKLKKEANKEGLKGKHKDAYVYGTLRKTGWKPKREMHTMDKVTYLHAINEKLEFAMDPDYEDDRTRKNRSLTGAVGTGVVGAGTIGGGLYAAGKMAPTSWGGQGLSGMGAAHDLGKNLGNLGGGGAARIGSNIGQGAKVAGGALKKLLSYGKSLFSDKQEKLIQLNSKIDAILEFDQEPENNLRRGAGFGLLGGGPVGAVTGGFQAKRFQKAGEVYRKRDAFGNAIGGLGAGVATQIGAQSGIIGARAAGGALGRAAEHIPVGAVGLAGTAVGIGVQRHLASNRLKRLQAGKE